MSGNAHGGGGGHHPPKKGSNWLVNLIVWVPVTLAVVIFIGAMSLHHSAAPQGEPSRRGSTENQPTGKVLVSNVAAPVAAPEQYPAGYKTKPRPMHVPTCAEGWSEPMEIPDDDHNWDFRASVSAEQGGYQISSRERRYHDLDEAHWTAGQLDGNMNAQRYCTTAEAFDMTVWFKVMS